MRRAGQAALTLILLAPASAQQKPFSIRLNIHSSSEALPNPQLRSCVANKLRELPGVIVTSELPGMSVGIVGLELEGAVGGRLGFAASMATVRGGILQQAVHVAPTLTEICTAIVADIDDMAIEPAREAYQAAWSAYPSFPVCEPSGSHYARHPFAHDYLNSGKTSEFTRYNTGE